MMRGLRSSGRQHAVEATGQAVEGFFSPVGKRTIDGIDCSGDYSIATKE